MEYTSMKLPRFIRQIAAQILVSGEAEVGGMLHDYANGRWKELAKWNTQEGANEAIEIVDNMLQRGRDNIYVAMIKCRDFGRGYFIVHDSNFSLYHRAFWLGAYNPDEAFIDVAARCRKIADKMGYRR